MELKRIWTSVKEKLFPQVNFVLVLLFLLGFSGILSAQNGVLNMGEAPYDTPCDAALYDFDMGQLNVVPCGPSANTTSSLSIDLLGSNTGTFPSRPACDCQPGSDVLWVSFMIQEGGSFEWQTVPGADRFYWALYYLNIPDPVPTQVNYGCDDLTPSLDTVFLECGEEFTGWKVQSTPNPGQTWRFFLAFCIRGADKDGLADGVIKIRKSCGLACTNSDISVVASPDVCIESGNSTPLTATPSGGGSTDYKYLWTPTDGLSCTDCPNPTANPTTTTTYYVTAYTDPLTGGDGCPATDSVTVTVGGCCEAYAGSLANDASGPLEVCEGKADLDGVTFFTDPNDEAAMLDYAILLTDMAGNIISAETATFTDGSTASTTFSVSTLTAGMYFVYGLSWDQANSGGVTLADFLADININTIGDIQTAIADPAICADLTGGTASEKITVFTPNCGTFIWDGN